MIAVENTTLELAANLAVGGATTDADLVTPYAPFPTVYSFKDQLGDFETYLNPAPSAYPWESDNTLFSVWMGVNDVGNGWYSSDPAWTTLLVEILDEYFEFVDALYQAGGRKFLFLTVPPIQLTPYVISLGQDTVDALAAAVPQYNDQLQTKFDNFTSTYSDVTGWVFDTTDSFTTPVSDPTAYGATDATCDSTTGTTCLWFNNCEFRPVSVKGEELMTRRPSRAGNPRSDCSRCFRSDWRLVIAVSNILSIGIHSSRFKSVQINAHLERNSESGEVFR